MAQLNRSGLDPKAQPKQAIILMGECGFPKYVNQTAKAIYKLEGKSLTKFYTISQLGAAERKACLKILHVFSEYHRSHSRRFR